MALPDLGRSRRIAATELRRTWRGLAANRSRLLLIAVFLALWGAVPTVGLSYLAHRTGRALAEGAALPVLQVVRGGLAVAWIGLGVLLMLRATGRRGTPDEAPLLLTTAPAADVAGGLMLAELGRVGAILAVPLGLILGAFSLGLGSPLPFVLGLAAVTILLGLAVLVATAVGLLLRRAAITSALVVRYKTPLTLLLVVAYFALLASQALNQAAGILFATLQGSPMAWFGDLALVGAPHVGADPVRALGAVVLAALLAPALMLAGVQVAGDLWVTDPAAPSHRREGEPRGTGEAPATRRSRSASEVLLSPLVPGPVRHVAAVAWLRARRNPLKLIYLLYPMFVLWQPFYQAAATGTVPATLPPLVTLYGVWAAGATALNPLGDEGAMLPTTVLAIPGRTFVAGQVLAGAAPFVPLVVVLTALLGALSPLPTAEWAGLAVVGAALTVAGVATAAGLGTVFPRFSASRVARSRQVVVPSRIAFLAYTLLVLLATGAALILALPGPTRAVAGLLSAPAAGVSPSLGAVLADVAGAGDLAVRAGGLAAFVVLAAGVPWLAWRRAVGAYERFTVS